MNIELFLTISPTELREIADKMEKKMTTLHIGQSRTVHKVELDAPPYVTIQLCFQFPQE